MNFDDLGLSPALVRAVKDRGYSTPTPVQAKSIPLILSGKDVLAAAQTGTGKTAAFVLPLLQRLSVVGAGRSKHVRSLVLTPTRELAIQVNEALRAYGQHLSVSDAVVFGGVKAGPQITTLALGVDVLVATPGRLLDLHGHGAIDFSCLEVLVLDEADRMLDMGFIHDIKRIVSLLPRHRQTLMFSATFSKEIRTLASSYLTDPESVQVTPANTTSKLVKQAVYPVDQGAKADLLVYLINVGEWPQVLVFTRTKHGANRLCKNLLKEGIEAASIHSDKSQTERQKVLSDFKAGKMDVLVATDVAARGLDIDQLPEVVNFDLPSAPEDYVHRIGRTGRAGATGRSHSLVCAEEADLLRSIERVIGGAIPKICIDGFGAQTALAALNARGVSTGKTRPPSKPRPGGNHSGGPAKAASTRDGAGAAKPKRRRGPSPLAGGSQGEKASSQRAPSRSAR